MSMHWMVIISQMDSTGPLARRLTFLELKQILHAIICFAYFSGELISTETSTLQKVKEKKKRKECRRSWTLDWTFRGSEVCYECIHRTNGL